MPTHIDRIISRIVANVFNREMIAELLELYRSEANPDLASNPEFNSKCVNSVKVRLANYISLYDPDTQINWDDLESSIKPVIESISLYLQEEFAAALTVIENERETKEKELSDKYYKLFVKANRTEPARSEFIGLIAPIVAAVESVMHKEPVINRAAVAKVRPSQTVVSHFAERITAKEAVFRQTRGKPSGISEGYIGASASDAAVKPQEYMFKFARKTSAPFDNPKKPGTQINRNGNSDTRDFLCEFMMAPLYQRMLYNRSPVIAAVESSSPDVISMRSKFLPGAQTISEYTKSNNPSFWGSNAKTILTQDKVEGMEKLWAAYLAGGEEDIHLGNAVVMDEPTGEIDKDGKLVVKKVYGKIDLGRSGAVMFTQGEKMWNNFSSRYFGYAYDANVELDASKFSSALSSNTKISQDEIERYVKSRMQTLKEMGFDPYELAVLYWLDDEYKDMLHSRTHPRTKMLDNFNDLEEFYIDLYQKHWKSQEEFLELVVAAEKMTNPAGKEPTPGWVKGEWIKYLKGENPVKYALDNGLQIDGQEPMTYAFLHGIKIGGLDPVSYALANGKAIGGLSADHYQGIGRLDPVIYAQTNGLMIAGQSPINYAVNHGIKVTGLDPTIYAEIQDPKLLIDGKGAIEYAASKGIKVDGLDPVLYAYKNKWQIAGQNAFENAVRNDIKVGELSAVEYAAKHAIKIDGKDPLEYTVQNNLKIDKLEAIEFAILHSIKIAGEHPIEYAVRNNIKISGQDPISYARDLYASELKDSITKEVLKNKLHYKPNEKEKRDIEVLVNMAVDKIGGYNINFNRLSPELRQKIAHDIVADYKASIKKHQEIEINSNTIEIVRQIVQFDDVLKTIKSSFICSSEDYKKLYKQYENTYKGLESKLTPDQYKASICQFIRAFKSARGGGQRIDKSILHSKEFAEAMKLHISDAGCSTQLLNNLKREKRVYNPAELCRAYNACMHNIQEIHSAIVDKQKADYYIDLFTGRASSNIAGAKRIDNHLLDGLRDKMIPGSPFITSHRKRNDIEFAKDFATHFPVLKNILEKFIIDLHPKKYEGSKDKQKYLDHEVRKLAGEIAAQLQHGDRKISVHHEFSSLENDAVAAVAYNEKIEDRAELAGKLKDVLTSWLPKKHATRDFSKVTSQAYNEENCLRYIKKNYPSLYKKIDDELKGAKDPLKYSTYVAAAYANIMQLSVLGNEDGITQIDKLIKLSELGAKLDFPFNSKVFDLEKGGINPGFVDTMLAYSKDSIDMMAEKYPNIINAITEQYRAEVIFIDANNQEQYNYKGYIEHINRISAEIAKYDTVGKRSFNLLNKQLEKAQDASPDAPYRNIAEAIAECKNQANLFKAVAKTVPGQAR